MDNNNERAFVNRPLILDGTNYDYWKACKVPFLKSMDRKTWKVVIKGWTHPMITAQDGTQFLTPE